MFKYVNPPSLVWNRKSNDRFEQKMSSLIQVYTPGAVFDVGILGVPLSRSSISPSAASENPNAIRLAWQRFESYNIDYDVELSDLRIVDFGDIQMHTTDIPRCHQNIEHGFYELLAQNQPFLPVIIGGDHSITCPLVKGLKRKVGERTIGLIQFDTHFDLRNLQDGGASNGTPIRGLIESGTVKGKHVINIGLHGYFNAYAYKQYADEQQVQYITLREVRKRGIETVIAEAVQYLTARVDDIYVTVDMDVLDIAFAPAPPAATPGGLFTQELLEAVYLLGQEHHVRAMDLVCVDPHRDDPSLITVKTAAYVILNFLCGFKQSGRS